MVTTSVGAATAELAAPKAAREEMGETHWRALGQTAQVPPDLLLQLA
jgi:hypothetical protein